MGINTRATVTSAIAIAAFTAASAAQIELTNNGGFETGDTSGWQDFTAMTPGSSSFLTTGDASEGAFAAEIFNNVFASAALVKQANIGIGQVSAGDEVTITFDAKGSFAAGGVAFAEFFSEIDGGGTSSTEILGGAPLALTDQYQTFSFTTTAGPDVSGGVTLQFNAATGAVSGSTAVLFIDNVSVSIIPAPATAGVLAMGGLVAMRRRR